jgi:S-(hydroxymethyl)glutathione dehydrogenase/alcohol dehydrogenase
MTVEDIELSPPRAGEVRVRMAASGVCHSCQHVVDGSFPGVTMPVILGDEGAGVVEEVGAGVTRVVPGDHVIISWAPTCGHCRYCVRGRPVLCENPIPFGFLRDGSVRFHLDGKDVHHFGPATYASEVILPEDMTVPIRKDMPLELAALIGCSVTTGVGAVTNAAQVPAGASLVVIGCGGIGLNAIQGGRLVSAEPIIAVDLDPIKLEAARVMGATHTIDGRDVDVPAAIRELTAGRGAEYAVIAVGNASAVEQAWASLAKGGTAVLLGLLPPGEKLAIDPLRLMGHECRLIGASYGSSRPSDDFGRLVELYMSGKLLLDELISHRYQLDQVNEAHQALFDGGTLRGLLVYE